MSNGNFPTSREVSKKVSLITNEFTMKLDFESTIVLENNRVRMEPLEEAHFEHLVPIVLEKPDLLKYSPPKFGTSELLLTYIKKNIALRPRQLKYPFVIFDKAKQVYAGSTSYMNISLENQRLEIGSTWIGKAFQRTGLNRNCKFLLMQYAFDILEIERIEFKTDKRNLQSQKAIEGIGGQYEGLLRSHTLMSDGYRRDTVYYSVLKEEWQGIRESVFAGM